MRAFIVMALLTAGIAKADDDAVMKLIAKRGYKAPVVVYQSPSLTIATAKKGGKPRLVIVAQQQQLVDAGAVGKGTLAVARPADHAIGVPGLTQFEVSYQTARANEGWERKATYWLVRDDGSIACAVSAGDSDSSGKACGSSGWTQATATIKPGDAGGTFFDVRYDSSGNFSEPDGKGACLKRSPVRSSRMLRWVVPAKGTCKPGTPPTAIHDDPL